MCTERAIFVKIAKNLQKIALSAQIGTRKMVKTQNNPHNYAIYCSKDPKVHVYQFVGQLYHFPGNA